MYFIVRYTESGKLYAAKVDWKSFVPDKDKALRFTDIHEANRFMFSHFTKVEAVSLVKEEV